MVPCRTCSRGYGRLHARTDCARASVAVLVGAAPWRATGPCCRLGSGTPRQSGAEMPASPTYNFIPRKYQDLRIRTKSLTAQNSEMLRTPGLAGEPRPPATTVATSWQRFSDPGPAQILTAKDGVSCCAETDRGNRGRGGWRRALAVIYGHVYG